MGLFLETEIDLFLNNYGMVNWKLNKKSIIEKETIF